MAEIFESIRVWFFELGENYGVNPIIFGSIYVGAIPFFTLSVAWLVKNYRKEKSIVLPALSSGLFFVSSYLYLIVVGRNVPAWVYIFIVVMVVGGGFSSYKKIQQKIEKQDNVEGDGIS